MVQQLIDLTTGVFQSLSTDEIALGILLIVVLGSGLALRGFGHIVSMTLGALIVFAVALFARDVVQGGDPMALAEGRWNHFLGLEMGTFLVYFIAFAIVITVIFLVKSMFQRAA